MHFVLLIDVHIGCRKEVGIERDVGIVLIDVDIVLVDVDIVHDVLRPTLAAGCPMLGLEEGADDILHRPLVEVHLPLEDGVFAEVEVLEDEANVGIAASAGS